MGLTEIEFGSYLFQYARSEGKLYLHSSDLDGHQHVHAFFLEGAFLVNLMGHYWRLVTGAGQGATARYIFDDVSPSAPNNMQTLKALGLPVLNKDSGKQNLERYGLPVKRLLLGN